MKRLFTVLLVLAAGLSTFAAGHAGFSADAFNFALPAASTKTAVFAPLAFEIDSAIVGEAGDEKGRKKAIEVLGAMKGIENAYRPLLEDIAKAASSNAVVYRSARAFCVPSVKPVERDYRLLIQRAFRTEIFAPRTCKGAEQWFRARLEGGMENFVLPENPARDGHYSYLDVLDVRIPWLEAFPTANTREIAFRCADGSSRRVKALCDLRKADLWRRGSHDVLRLPLAAGMWFYAVLPHEGVPLAKVRDVFTAAKAYDLAVSMTSVDVKGLTHGPVAVVIPEMDVVSSFDLGPVFAGLGLETANLQRLGGKGLKPNVLRQVVRFRLDASGPDGRAPREKPAGRVVNATADTQRFVLNRPFLFFSYHEETTTVPYAGLFTAP